MKITLISPRLAVQKGDFLGSGVPYWPLDMAVYAAFLREKGHAVTVIDLFGTSPSTLEDYQDHYMQGKPLQSVIAQKDLLNSDWFILYAMSSMSHQEVLRNVSLIKQMYPEVVVAVLENSQAVTAYDISKKAQDFFDHQADFLICGEAYWNWDEIQSFVMNGFSSKIPSNVIVRWSESSAVQRIYEMHPCYPVPAWDLFPIKNYWKLPYSHGPKPRRYLPILTSRGCSYPCDFCVVPSTNQQKFRGRSPSEVVDEMLQLRDKYGVRHFQVEDLNPTLQKNRWVQISELLIKRNANIFFYFVSGTKAETISVSDVALLAKAGCRYISVSPETGSARVLKAIGKPFNYEHGIDFVSECHQNGISTQACFLVGHPAETEADHLESMRYMKKLVQAGLDEVAVFVVAPLPGSSLSSQREINMISEKELVSFSPKGRENWDVYNRRRAEMVRAFLLEKIKKGLDIWIEAIRSIMGFPRTKMGNLPLRVVFISWLVLSHRVSTSLRGLFQKA